MSSQVGKESIYTGPFRELSQQANEPDWLRELRRRAFDVFTEKGFPTVKQEDWKYTNVAPIANENWVIEPKTIRPFTDESVRLLVENFDHSKNGFRALNLAFSEVSVVRIPKETSVADPSELSFAAEAGKAAFPHVIVIAESGSKATLVETY